MATKDKAASEALKEKAIVASGRIGQTVTLNRGILRGKVKIVAVKTSYGKPDYLCETAEGEREWFREESLTFNGTTPTKKP